ncbi:MAG TPA: pseudouridine synthase [Thermoleophilia bacterium]|nr:pseudouridine synthase [Thermoleophilia bacterium]
MIQRLQRVLASAGLGSRRSCEDLIREGRVTVDGRTAELGSSVDPSLQAVLVDGVPIHRETLEYWLLNKPKGVVSTAKDPQGRRTVVDCVPASVRIFPVGRLDADTTGALLLTNDGALAHRLLHPSYGVEKEYRVVVVGRVTEVTARRLAAGIDLEDGVTAPARVVVMSSRQTRSELGVRIHEGRNRQIRRMLEAVGHPVVELHRVGFGPLSDAAMVSGASRHLEASEIEGLRRLVDL